MNIFDMIGPVMVGPSSSHTAGAVRIARVVRMLLAEDVKKVVIKLHGSFAATYKGHGTDRAIIGGLLGFATDDVRIKDSLKLAEEKGMEFTFQTAHLGDVHPNTVWIEAEGVAGKKISVLGSSVGGGNIVIRRINRLDVEFTGRYHTLIVKHTDKPGMVAVVTGLLGEKGINIAEMRVYRSSRGGSAIMVIETDQEMDGMVVADVRSQPDVKDVAYIDPI